METWVSGQMDGSTVDSHCGYARSDCRYGLLFNICWEVVYKSGNLKDWSLNLADGSA